MMFFRNLFKDKAYYEAEKKIEKVQRLGELELDLYKMNLTELPESLGKLNHLKSLNLGNNKLEVLPEWFTNLKKLKTLRLNGNLFTGKQNSLDSLQSLTQLETVSLFGNALTDLPDSIFCLSNLRKLDLFGNELKSLPEVIGNLGQLQELNLSNNTLNVLPESLGQLTRLRILNLSHNKLTKLPELLGQLRQLQVLALADNHLITLPETLAQLVRLQLLDLSYNQLTTVPEWFGNYNQLESLILSYNHLTKLPEVFGQLILLKELHLGGNQLTALPNDLENLTALETLSIHENSFGSLPEVVRNLKSLKSLRVWGNQILFLSEWLIDLSEIEVIDARRCRLTDLPLSLGQLEHLRTLDLTENPLNSELAEAYKRGVNAVKAYLRAKAESKILNEAKLILVGEGEVGKTCLMDALLDKIWQEHPSTHGIEIQQIKVTYLEEKNANEVEEKGESADESNRIITRKEITLNGWDFGGQRVYRPTHQLFFSAPAVYLVVWKPREGPQQGFVKEWIQLVKRREPSAKILVVATHGGPQQRQPDIDRQELWDLFGKDTVVDFFFVDSKPDAQGHRKGIAELKEAIARVAAELPEVGRSVPKSFADVRAALQATGAPYLPFDEVLAICRAHNMDDEIARLFITISHRLGHLTHYENDPALRDIVILRPDWLASAMSYVLDDEETRKAHGLVDFSHLGHLWDDPTRPADTRYPATLHRIFLRLMERFDLSYRVAGLSKDGDSNPVSLIAQLVPDTTPKEEDFAKAWTPELAPGDIQQTQICRIVDAANGQSANAEGLFYQLIVRLHKYSLGRVNYNDSIHWQRGLILDANYNGRALLRHLGNDVHITVRAAFPERFLGMLTEEVKYLVESFWEGLRCEVTVPCIATPDCKGLFEVSKLIDNKKRGRPEMPCPICNEWQNIDQLLNNSPAATPSISNDKLYAEFIKVKDEIYSIRSKLEQQHGEVLNRFINVSADLQKLFSQAENNLNIIMQGLADEAKEGPRLFSLVPIEQDRFDPRNWTTSRFRLTLWCEHSHVPLTVLNTDKTIGVYEFDLTRQWVEDYSPLIKAFTVTLKSLLPVAFSAAKLVIDAATYKNIEDELDFSKSCVDALISEGEGMSELLTQDTISGEPMNLSDGKRITAQNATLREFHVLLNKVDPSRKYGNLHKVTNKRNEFLWVHEKFAGEY